MRRIPLLLAGLALAAGIATVPHLLASRASATGDFVHFESAHVHPACLTPGGDRLLVVNTPDNRLSVFDVSHGPPGRPNRVAEIPVGLEPVSVAALSDSEAWVVNQLSDDVSIVNLNTLHVRATLRVGDEPADVVFAGNPLRAYVSVSQLDLVRVIDPATLATSAVIPIDGRMPRALARSPRGGRVYVTVLDAGNRSSVLSMAEAGDSLPPPSPPKSSSLPAAPKVGLIIRQLPNIGWVDETGRQWSAKAQYFLFDTDIAEIATASNSVSRTFGDLSTVNLALAVSPADSTVALTGTEARNLTRFEPNLRGHLVDTRLALVAQAGTAALINLNPAIDYSVTPGPQAEKDSAIGNPTGAAWSADGQRLYVTALADNRLVVLTAAGAVRGRAATVPGPTGVVVDDARQRLYVVGRFHNEIQTLSTRDFSQLGRTGIGFDPTPDAIVNGRKFFYGGFTSGHGDQACATCHVHGDFDNIAWDLGNPQGAMAPKPPGQIDPALQGFHPMKGPMTTQSLRGMANEGPMHWRGDRSGANNPGGSALDEDADFKRFIVAFDGLLGRGAPISGPDMQRFTDFILQVTYPPNPNRGLNNALVGDQLAGRNLYFGRNTDIIENCNGCHVLNPSAGFFGTDGLMSIEGEPQEFKIPHLRNAYQKVGMFGMPKVAFFRDGDATSLGTQVRGFGFLHDGSVDTLFRFHAAVAFLQGPLSPGGFSQDPATNARQRHQVEAFMLAFDSNVAPIVGQQVTVAANTGGDAAARVDLLEARAAAGECDLVVHAFFGTRVFGFLYEPSTGMFLPDTRHGVKLTDRALRALRRTGPLTFTAVPPQSGRRIALDRDLDGVLDGDE